MGRTSLQVELLPSAALATDRNGPPSVLCARRGLALFDCKALGYNHKQSRRFFDKDYPLFRDDVCLRSWVEKRRVLPWPICKVRSHGGLQDLQLAGYLKGP